VRPIPTAFHVGPLELHTYGLGLAVAFYVAWRVLVKRIGDAGYRTDWLVSLGVWVAVSAVVGARLLHVLTNLSAYTSAPLQTLEVWHGGLSSFGGLLLAVPTAIVVAKKKCPELSVRRGLDLAVTALALGWSIGRLLGPQLMVAGGGHRTNQWFGMYYAGQAGKRIPVPIIQALEDGALFVVLVLLERQLRKLAERRAPAQAPTGALTAVAMIVWGIVRALDERLWLGEDGRLGSLLVQVAGVALAAGGIVLGIVVLRQWRAFLRAPSAPGIEGAASLTGT
jgi:phosphatidylglycerol---prolipoprotein diacylglyceryl transferase